MPEIQVLCPFCGDPQTQRLAHWASRLLGEQWWCEACHSAFDWVPEPRLEKDGAI